MSESLAVIGPGEVVILAPAVLPELLAAVQGAPGMSREATAAVRAMRDAAVRYQLRKLRERSAAVPQAQGMAASASPARHVGALEGETVGVDAASVIIGCSARWTRELCKRGRLAAGLVHGRDGCQPARAHWEIELSSVHAYRQLRSADAAVSA